MALGWALAIYTAPSSAQQPLPYDTQAVFRTHLPHLASGHGGGGGGGKPGSGGAPTVAFTDAVYPSVAEPVTATTTGPEAEEHIAADPASNGHLVAAISDFSLRGGSNTTKYAVSTNGGSSWADAFVPLVSGSPATGDGRVWPYNSDPVVAIDAAGRVFLADLYFHSEAGDGSNGLYVTVGSDLLPNLGLTDASTTYPVAVQTSPSTTIDEDKEWIAVDNSSAPTAGNVYVSWTRFIGNSDMILLSRSTNHGQNWSSPLQISLAAQDGAVQGSAVAVGPSGEVYVAYEVFFVGGKRQQFLAKSVDGGQTFSPATAATPLFNELSFNSTYRKNTFASIAVSPGTDGTLYMVYAAQTGRGSSVEFVRSAGTGFSTPLALNDSSTGQRLMPSIAADFGGLVHAAWFDARLGSANNSTKYDIFATRSLSAGAAFSPNQRVTTASVDAGTASFIGDYGGIAATVGESHPVWTNGGFNGGRLQTATLK